MNELSIFIDESGDFGRHSSGYYIVSLVFHEQRHPIALQVERLEESLRNLGLDTAHAVHTGAAIRGEDEYRTMPVETRKAAFTRIFSFTRTIEVTYEAFAFRKSEYADRLKLKGALSRSLSRFFRENAEYFLGFDKVVAYYDNGQAEITDVLNTVLNAFFFEVDFRKVGPADYRLFQAADLICTLELLRLKADDKCLSRSDVFFFRDVRTLRRDYLRKIAPKRYGS